MAEENGAVYVEGDSDTDSLACPICMEDNRPAIYSLILTELEKLNLPCPHKFCEDCANLALQRGKCHVCSHPVVRVLVDQFAENVYKERVKYVDERKALEKRTAEVERAAQEHRDALATERDELLRDAEMKHRQALEDQFHQQEEMARQLEERHREETERLNEKLTSLQSEKERATSAQQQMELEARMKAEAEALQRRHAQDQMDLGASVAHLRARREATDNAIRGQLQEELGRSRAGKIREDHNHLRNSGAFARQNGNANGGGRALPSLNEGENPENEDAENIENLDPNSDKANLLSFSTVALRSVAFAAASWSSQAWNVIEKIAKPLFSSSTSRLMRLGRVNKPMGATSAPLYIDFALLSKPPEQFRVRKSIPLPRYKNLSPQPTAKISPEELSKNALYFYCFREAMMQSLINHPNILSYYAPLISADDSIVLEAPFVPLNVSLFAAEMLAGNADEGLENIRTVIRHLLLATNYLHTLSVYHLNIKPSSVLVYVAPPSQQANFAASQAAASGAPGAQRDPQSNSEPIRALLTAFSKARARGSHNAFVATLDLSDYAYALPYMSPEFARIAEETMAGRATDRIEWDKVDSFAIGCVLMSLLARGCDLFAGVKNAAQLEERARQLNVAELKSFVTRSMRRRRRPSMPDLAQSLLFDDAIRLAADLLRIDSEQRANTETALQSNFINFHGDLYRPTVTESFDDSALPLFALRHKGVPNRSQLIEED